jgi:GT2 family glycosyltransferase
LKEIVRDNKGGKEIGFDIFVPTHGRLDLTTSCIQALYERTQTPFHLIVADTEDQKKDLTSIFLQGVAEKYPDVTYLRPPEGRDYKSGNEFFNQAFAAAKTDYIVTCMNSVRVEPEWEIAALSIMKNQKDVGIVGFKCFFPTII